MNKLRVTQCTSHTVSWICALSPLFWKMADKILVQGNSDIIVEKVVTKYKRKLITRLKQNLKMNLNSDYIYK